MIDVSKIGQDAQFQDPMDAIKAQTGTYNDPIQGALAVELHYPQAQMPKAPDKNPFKNLSAATGQR
jgi:hypothetical protein